ncbi:MAG: hypothetical protein LBF97_05615, partial [Elusimicrobiota bacterium]|nr:hypothetical protein [Elusimicrobiota bacterium]
MQIEVSDSILKITEYNKEEKKALLKFTTYVDQSACFLGGHYDFKKEKNITFLKEIKETALCSFPGFAKEIIMFCKENKFNFEIIDKRTHFPFQNKQVDFSKYFKFKYTEHQQRALQAMQ